MMIGGLREDGGLWALNVYKFNMRVGFVVGSI